MERIANSDHKVARAFANVLSRAPIVPVALAIPVAIVADGAFHYDAALAGGCRDGQVITTSPRVATDPELIEMCARSASQSNQETNNPWPYVIIGVGSLLLSGFIYTRIVAGFYRNNDRYQRILDRDKNK